MVAIGNGLGLGAVLLGAVVSGVGAQEVIEKDYCGVGAGPAGCQLGFFWETAQRDYIILEKADGPGSFFRCAQVDITVAPASILTKCVVAGAGICAGSIRDTAT